MIGIFQPKGVQPVPSLLILKSKIQEVCSFLKENTLLSEKSFVIGSVLKLNC